MSDQTDERPDNATDDSTGFASFRRDLLKAVGAGGALSVLGGSAAGVLDGEGAAQMEDGEEPTVHTVLARIEPSTNPKRPADFFFQPTGLAIEPGDVVRFVFESPDHTVTSYHPAYGSQRRIPPGEEAFSSPVLGWDPDSLPDDLDMPPAADGTLPSDGEAPPEEGTPMPGEETPAEETPAEETPAEETPGAETPAEETPAPGEATPTEATPAEETPAAETPAEETPAAETPAAETPAAETPAGGVATPGETEPASPTPGAETTPAAEGETTQPVTGGADTVQETPGENAQETPGDGTPETPEDGATEMPEDGAAQASPSVWFKSFDTPGVYDLRCASHEFYGMAMRIVVGEETQTSFETEDMTALPAARTGPFGLARTVLTDLALRPEDIVAEGEVRWQDLQTYNAPDEGDGEAPGDGETPEEGETPTEETPAEETPAEETPAEETPGETPAETPAEETPAAETPAEGTPAEETPVEGTPAEETPVGTPSGNESGPL